jgi:hypothetical protein
VFKCRQVFKKTIGRCTLGIYFVKPPDESDKGPGNLALGRRMYRQPKLVFFPVDAFYLDQKRGGDYVDKPEVEGTDTIVLPDRQGKGEGMGGCAGQVLHDDEV